VTIKRFYRRRFLNLRGFHAGAYVLADCRLDSFRSTDGTRQYSIDAELTIADCGRVTALDFCVSDERAAQNAVYKARLLRDVVVEFTTALEAALDDWRDQET
jgi:hypothetical protein